MRKALLGAWLAAIACGPSGTGGTRQPGPASPVAKPNSLSGSEPHESAAIDRADTITFQYPNGLQTQVVERSMWVRLIIGPGAATAPVNITLDSIRMANVPRDSLLSADGLRWTGTL